MCQVPLLQRVQAAAAHYQQTGSRALKEGRHILSTLAKNYHLGPTSNPLLDMQQLRYSLSILYRGFGLSVLGAQPVYAVYFGAYEAGRAKLPEVFPEGTSASLMQIAAGFLAECVAVSIWNPWEVVRQRMQLASSTKRTVGQTVTDILAESGVRGFYVGIGGYLALW